MRRALTWIGGAFGVAALLRFLRRRREEELWAPAPLETADDPAAELRRRLAEAREAPDDRDEFDAAEGVPLDQAEPEAASSIEARRRAVHDKAEAALEEMRGPAGDE